MERTGFAWTTSTYVWLAFLGAVVGGSLAGAPKLVALSAWERPAPPAEGTAAALRPSPASRYEILAFEAQGCTYCANFRADIARSYAKTERAATAPVRFVDVNAGEVSRLKLAGAITQLPTAVVMRDGEEVGRIGGYVGRENFYRILDTLISR